MADLPMNQSLGSSGGPVTPPVDITSKLMRNGTGSKGVERAEVVSAGVERAIEKPAEVVELPESPELEVKPDLNGYIENIEKAAEDAPLVVDDYTGQILLNPAQQTPKTIVLPLTEAQVSEGLQHQVWESVRWLAEWCVRQMKLVQGQVKFKN